jgi:DNA polymerase III sliding clamp (beta) subunit (PCNA family)
MVAVRCAEIQNGLSDTIALSTQFLLDALRRIDGERVMLSFAANEHRVVIQSDNPNYFYVAQRVKHPSP